MADDGSLLLAGRNRVHYQLADDGTVLSAIAGFHDVTHQVFRNSGTTYSSRGGTLRISGASSVNTGNSIHDIYAHNGLVYIATSNNGLQIWDHRGNNSPYLIGSGAAQYASSVIVNNNIAYVAYASTIRVVDVSTPSNPNVIGLFDANANLSNISPVANTLRSQSVTSGDNVTLDGTFSRDADGSIVDYAWVQTSGTPVVLNNANTATPSFTALYDANQTRLIQRLYFKLTVTDNDGAKGSDTVQISVGRSDNGDGVVGGGSGGEDGGGNSNSNAAPVANAGSSITVKSRARVRLNGRSSYDTDGSIVKYSWKQISGKRVRLRRAQRSVAKFRAPRVRGSAIQLGFELTVTDNKGKTAKSRVTITVRR